MNRQLGRLAAAFAVALGVLEAAWATDATWNVDSAGAWTTPGNWTNSLVPNGVGDSATFGGAITANRIVTLDAPQTVGVVTFDDNNSYTLSGTNNMTVDKVGGVATVEAVNGAHTISSPIFLADSLRVTVGSGQTLTTSGNIGLNTVDYYATSQTPNFGSIIKEGSGTWDVTGGTWTAGRDNASYANPAFFVNAGTLKLSSGNPLGQNGRMTVIASGATVQLAGGSYGTSHTLLDGGTISGSNNFNTDIYGIYATSGTISTGSANTVYTGMWKVGAGTLTISGGFTGGNSYGNTSGGLNLYEGTVTLNGANGALNYSTANCELRLLGGTLQLDNTGTNNNNRLANAASGRFVVRGGELDVRSHASTALAETAAPLALLGGGAISLTASGNVNGSVLAFNGALTRSSQGTALVRGRNLGDSLAANVAQVTFGTPPTLSNAGSGTTQGILPYFTVDKSAAGIGTDLATYGATGVRPLTAGEYNTVLNAGDNVKLAGSTNTSGSIALNSLVLSSGGSGVTLTNTGNTLTISSAAILSTGTDANTITGGTVTADANSALGASHELAIHTARDLNLSAVVADNGANAVKLTKAGGGRLTLDQTNTHTGGTFVTDGTLRLASGATNILPDARDVSVANGTLDLGDHSETVNTLNVYGGTVTGTTGVLTSAGGNRVRISGGEIAAILGGGSSGTTQVRSEANALSGNGVFTRAVLSGANTFAGVTMVGANTTLTLRNGSALGVADGASGNRTEVAPNGTLALESGITVGNEALTLNGVGQSYGDNLGPWAVARRGALRNVSGTNTWGGTVTLGSTANIGSDSGSLVLSAANSITAPGTGRNLRLEGESTGANEVQGTVTILDGTLFKDGLGTWRLSSAGSNYTGKSFIYNGTLEVASLANLSANSSLGAPTTVANGTIDLGSATLRYIGSGASTTNRVVNLLASGNLDASGSGSVTFTSAVTGTGQNLALLGSGAGELSAGAGTGSGGTLVKSGSGTWTVGGTSTYTGETHVLQGTLVVDGSIATSSRVTVTAGATLAGSGTVPLIANAGLVSPGDSPGILTTTQVDPTLGTDYAFELTATGSPTYGNPTASVNDVLRMTDAGTPFVLALDADNAVAVYFGVATLTTGDLFHGGWYTDRGSDFIADISGAAFDYFVLGDGNGTHGFNGTDYYTLAELYGAGASVTVSTIAEAADFGDGDVNGYVTLFNVSVGVIPEPATLGVLALGAAGVALRRRRRGIGQL